MVNIFPKWSNWLPLRLLMCGLVLTVTAIIVVAYYFTPKYTRVGYQPVQPIAFSHHLHFVQLGLDCHYCHTEVQTCAQAHIPETQICMNCHSQIKRDSPKLEPLRESWRTGKPIRWVRVHQLPDHVYFNHAVHVNRGVMCWRCHGYISKGETAQETEPLSMGWCLECHRHPEAQLSPDHITGLAWKPSSPYDPETDGKKFVKDFHISPPVTCSGCHR